MDELNQEQTREGFSQEQYDFLIRCSKERNIEKWNEWREKDTVEDVFLRSASLGHIFLERADLRGANLYGANLYGAKLSGANLSGAYLLGANLSGAILSGAYLSGAILSGAYLIGAYLSGAKLYGAKLYGAKLYGAKLYGANLSGADCHKTTIIKANLTDAILFNTNLSDAKIHDSILTGIVFERTVTFGWELENIECDYIYLDISRKERIPKEGNFEKGEFVALYRSMPTIEYVFQNGMKWYDSLIMDKIAADFFSQYGTQLISIDNKGFRPKAVFAVSPQADKEQAIEAVTKEYDKKISDLSHQVEKMQELVLFAISQPRIQYISFHDIYQAQRDINIDNRVYTNALEEIKAHIEKESEDSFKGKPKKKVLEILTNTIRDIKTGAFNEVGKEIFDSIKDDLAPFVVNFAAQFAFVQGLQQLIK